MPISLELHRKIAGSFAAFVFVLFGLAMGLRLHHHERLITYVWVLGIFMSYYLLNIGVSAVVLKGWASPCVAMWIPNLIGAAVGGPMLAAAVRH